LLIQHAQLQRGLASRLTLRRRLEHRSSLLVLATTDRELAEHRDGR
jgi:hypothetical protein